MGFHYVQKELKHNIVLGCRSAACLFLLMAGNVSAQNLQPSATKAATTAPKQAPRTSVANSATALLNSDKQKLSYAVGLNIGKSLKKENVDVDTELLARGIRDVLTGAKALLTDEQVQTILAAATSDIHKKQWDQASKKNKEEGDAFLAANRSKAGVVTLPSGLQYKVIQNGNGPKPTVRDSVAFNYRGTHLDGTEIVMPEKQPVLLPIQQLHKGQAEAFQLMPVGSKWVLYIPSDLAYGDMAYAEHEGSTTIGPNETLIFEVELLSIKNHTPSVPQGTVNGIHWSTTPIPNSMTVAFSFSERCLQDSCGDGAWGADIERDSQTAIDGSASACETSTARKGSCGTGNGGRYFVACKPGDPPKWAALAIYNDGSENLIDGEAIAYSTKPDAEQAAVSNCNHDGCHVVWSQPINCGNQAQQAGNTYSGPYADWVQRLLGRVGAWSCPATPPSIRAEACMRDGQVAAAVKYAWAAECYAEAGRDDDAQKSANSMMEMLEAAQSLCSNVPTVAGSSGCDTLSILPCGSLQ